MRVFVTGATGFIGSAVVKDLLAAGHQVLGLTRSEEGANALIKAGAQAHHGSIEDLESLKAGAAQCDGIMHLAFNHDFSKFIQNCENDRHAIEALGSTILGTSKPMIVTSGTAITNTASGQFATEDAPVASNIPRAASEQAAEAVAAQGGNVSIVRLPQVHDTLKQGLITFAIDIAREKKQSAYIGDGSHRWPAAHVSDVARLYRLALEKAEPGAIYNAVAEEGVTMREIAAIIGRGLKLPVVSVAPEQAEANFGWLAMFITRDLPASGAKTKEKLGWHPTGPGLIADLEQLQFAR